MVTKEDALERIKEMCKARIIDSNAYYAITYNKAYGEMNYLNRYCSAETNTDFLNMVRRDFPNRY